MKIETVLILAAITVALADTKRSTNITSPKYNRETMYRKTFIPITIEERRKLSLFPKSATKFIVTQRPYKTENATLRMKSLMLPTKAIVIASTESLISRGFKSTRAPLLKPRRLTTEAPIQVTTQVISRRQKAKYAMLEDKTSKPDSYSTERNEDKVTRQYSRFAIRRPTSYVNSEQNVAKPNNHNSAEQMENAYRSEQSNEGYDDEPSRMDVKIVKNTVQDHKAKDKIRKETKENEEQVNRNSSGDTVKSFENTKAFSEINVKKDVENFDDTVDEEYLLVRDKRNQAGAGATNLLSDVEEDTTEYMEEVEQSHDKSKRNVLEEENLTSTVSGFKFTGKDTNLHSHLIYKNIHA